MLNDIARYLLNRNDYNKNERETIRDSFKKKLEAYVDAIDYLNNL